MLDFSRTRLITHKNCMDGSACAVLFLAAGGKKENIYFTQPSHDNVHDLIENISDDLISSASNFLLVDVSVSEDFAEWMGTLFNNRVKLLDHHRSSIPLVRFNWCNIERQNNRCGSRMLYDWLMIGGPDYMKHSISSYNAFVLNVDDNDRFMGNIADSRILATLHDTLGQELFVERFTKNSKLNLTDQEQFAVLIEQKKKNEAIKKAKSETEVKSVKIDDKVIRVGFVLSDRYQSEIGEAIYSDIDLNAEIAVIIGSKGVSLRSRCNCKVDLSKVAQLNLGGGHIHAAGCKLNNILMSDFLDLVATKVRWNGPL